MTIHPIPPVFDGNSRVLILGSFPSVRSRQEMFFYSHPQNRFWSVMAAVFGCPVPLTIEEKKRFLLNNRVALWDVIGSCDITGSSDSSIKNAVPNDMSVIFKTADIEKIFTNGKTAMRYYDRYLRNVTGIDAVCLPSTSPANAAFSAEKLIEYWKTVGQSH